MRSWSFRGGGASVAGASVAAGAPVAAGGASVVAGAHALNIRARTTRGVSAHNNERCFIFYLLHIVNKIFNYRRLGYRYTLVRPPFKTIS